MLNPLVTKAIRHYKDRYPNIKLQMKEANSLYLIECVQNDELDIAFIRPPQKEPEGLTMQLLKKELLIAALPVDYPVKDDRIPLSTLKDQHFVVSPYTVSAGLYEAIISACKAEGFIPEISANAPQIVSILSLVAANIGVTLVPETTRQLAINGIKYVQLTQQNYAVGLSLIYKKNYHSQPAINFASMVHDCLNQAI